MPARRTLSATVLAGIAIAGVGVVPATAPAAQRSCGSTKVTIRKGVRAKARVTVIKGSVKCATARLVTRRFFVAVRTGADRDSRGRFRVRGGWRCETALGGSQGACTKGRRLISINARTFT